MVCSNNIGISTYLSWISCKNGEEAFPAVLIKQKRENWKR
jgi:hypothetical protein